MVNIIISFLFEMCARQICEMFVYKLSKNNRIIIVGALMFQTYHVSFLDNDTKKGFLNNWTGTITPKGSMNVEKF